MEAQAILRSCADLRDMISQMSYEDAQKTLQVSRATFFRWLRRHNLNRNNTPLLEGAAARKEYERGRCVPICPGWENCLDTDQPCYWHRKDN